MLGGSWQIAKIRNIPLKLHFSWFIVFGLITWSLATQYFPQMAPELPQATNWLRGAIAALLLFLSVVIHELSHSFVAMYYNLPIQSITLFIFGGVAQIKKEPSDPGMELRMALAGPFSSYALALLFYFAYRVTGDFTGMRTVLFYLFQINLILGTFNLIPGFPMDGGRVLRAVLWKKTDNYVYATKMASKTGQWIALFFIFSGILSLFRGYGGSVWFLLIGWFLYTAAQSSYQQAAVRDSLAGIRVKDVMTRNVVTVDARLPVSQLIDNFFLFYGYGGFPVEEGGKVVGIVSLKEIRGLAKETRNDLTVRDIMRGADQSMIISEDEGAADALERMIRDDRGRLLVMGKGTLAGLVSRSGIARYLQVKSDLKGS